MAAQYDLMLLLDPNAPEGRDEQILGDVDHAIASGGTLIGRHDWGLRRMTFEIDHRPEAAYYLFQFEGGNELLERLDHMLKITDGVLRFRIFKVDPRSPVIEPPPPMALSSSASRAPGGRGRVRREDAEEQAPPQPPAEPVAAPQPAGE
jgi:small subunit ribosomal protein S6